MPPTHPTQADVAAAYRTLIAHETEPKEQDFYRTRLQRLEQATEPECEFDCRSRVAAAGVGVYCPQCSAKCADTDLATQLAIQQIEGEAAWWRSVGHDRSARRTFDSMTGDSQQAVRTGVERVLAHLQSTNHLVPAGGMALTAEQVEDVRLIASENYPLDSDPTASINRLRALFPATEPPEEAVGDPLQAWKEFLKPKPIGWYRTMTPQFATEHFGFPSVIGSKGFWTHTASDGGKWAWDGDDWELSEYSPAPAEPAGPCSRGVCSANNGHEGTCAEASGWAEPAEEETKAEELSNVELSCLKMICDLCKKSYKGTVWLPINDMVQGFIDRHYLTRDENDSCKPTINAEKALASLPVVPAPTETGPWDSIEEVPEGVTVRGTNPVAGLWRGGPYWKSVSPEHSAAVSSLAPFVAAEEG